MEYVHAPNPCQGQKRNNREDKEPIASTHSMMRAITLHPSRGIDGELLVGDGLAVFRCDIDLPGASRTEAASAFIHAAAVIAV